ncbi:MAG: hypothetical protein LUG65_02125 [Clostridiales bacterium]|nr:hypothetical protein [Clostridiales bacterium]
MGKRYSAFLEGLIQVYSDEKNIYMVTPDFKKFYRMGCVRMKNGTVEVHETEIYEYHRTTNVERGAATKRVKGDIKPINGRVYVLHSNGDRSIYRVAEVEVPSRWETKKNYYQFYCKRSKRR